jgi:hypothetical protein
LGENNVQINTAPIYDTTMIYLFKRKVNIDSLFISYFFWIAEDIGFITINYYFYKGPGCVFGAK